MKKMTILWLVLIFILVIALTIIGFNVIKRAKPYTSLENTIVEAMKVYYGQDTNLKKLPEKNKIAKISIEELKSFGLNLSLEVNDDKCEAYGIVKGRSLAFTYKAFIKCNNYITKDYEKYLKY